MRKRSQEVVAGQQAWIPASLRLIADLGEEPLQEPRAGRVASEPALQEPTIWVGYKTLGGSEDACQPA